MLSYFRVQNPDYWELQHVGTFWIDSLQELNLQIYTTDAVTVATYSIIKEIVKPGSQPKMQKMNGTTIQL